MRGVTLVELMISMTLGLFIVIGMVAAYIGARSSFTSQNAMAAVQENARYAFEFLSSDVRMVGFNGGPIDASLTQPVGWTGQKDLQNFPLRGYEEGVSTFPTFPVDRPRLRGDAIFIIHADTDNEYALDTTVSPNPTATTFTLASWPSSSPAVGGLMVAADYTHAAAFAITGVTSASKTISTTDNLNGFAGAIAARRIFPLKSTLYYIANNPGGEPSLYRLKFNSTGGTIAEEMVEGVQDMQITYGVDFNDPAAQTVITAATWAGGVATITSVGHGLVAGNSVSIVGVTPAAFNGTYSVSSAGVDAFTVSIAANPTAYTSGGTAQRIGDNSVDGYWTADAVDAGTLGTDAIPGAATQANYWKHVVSVRFTLNLTTKQTEKISTQGTTTTKVFVNTVAVRNRI